MLRRLRPTRGFTLIELLVVIAIIAILAAILFPVFARARAQARKAVCQSGLRQFGIALGMYLQDFDEQFPFEYAVDPPIRDETGALRPIMRWPQLLQPYIKNATIAECPDRSQAIRDNYKDFGVPRYWGYGWNECLYRQSLAIVTQPAETAVMADCNGGAFGCSNTPEASPSGWGNCSESRRRIAFANYYGSWAASGPLAGQWEKYIRHGEGSVICFVDGHVKYMASRTICSVDQLRITP
jgi:prepilin-type N-terminal cleavage/methylation domain-containing protein/prepilin-type processing-associated H-X9-DG protein